MAARRASAHNYSEPCGSYLSICRSSPAPAWPQSGPTRPPCGHVKVSKTFNTLSHRNAVHHENHYSSHCRMAMRQNFSGLAPGTCEIKRGREMPPTSSPAEATPTPVVHGPSPALAAPKDLSVWHASSSDFLVKTPIFHPTFASYSFQESSSEATFATCKF